MGLSYTPPPGQPGVDVTSAENRGSGIGAFISKVAGILRFKSFTSPSSEVTITDNVGAETIELDVDESQLDITATMVTNTPSGAIAATTVQAALNELDSEKAAASHTHAQSDVTNLVADLAAKQPSDNPLMGQIFS